MNDGQEVGCIMVRNNLLLVVRKFAIYLAT